MSSSKRGRSLAEVMSPIDDDAAAPAPDAPYRQRRGQPRMERAKPRDRRLCR